MKALGSALLIIVLLAGCGGDDSETGPAKAQVATPAKTRKCLVGEGAKVLGGRSRFDDRDAPQRELIVRLERASAFLAFYASEEEAEKRESSVRKNMEKANGSVERHGRLTIGWVRGDGSKDADRIRDCATLREP
jgi:hypothetical protein